MAIVRNKIRETRGHGGNILQKVYYVNTYILSKLWYIAQGMKLEQETLMTIDKECRAWIYRGEGEAPVNEVNYRKFGQGGLGLQMAQYKAKALLYKNSMKIGNDDNYVDQNIINRLRMEGRKDTKQIYEFFLKEKIEKEGRLVPSRAEKRELNVNWMENRRNMTILKGLTVEEREFAWRCTQDMLKIGARKHWGDPLRRKECRVRWTEWNGRKRRCRMEENRRHVFEECTYSRNKAIEIKKTISALVGRNVDTTSMIHLDYKCNNRSVLLESLKFGIRALRRIYLYREESLAEFKKYFVSQYEQENSWSSRKVFAQILEWR